jgi:phosphoglucan,water dikinase
MPESPFIRIGNQTAYSAATIMRPFEFAADNRFYAFEWFPDKKITGEGWLVSDIPKKTRSDIRRLSEARDMRLSVHAPWPSDPLTPSSAASFPETVEFAKDIGASLFNVHLRSDLGPAAFAEALRPLLALLGDAGIHLSVENTVYTSPSDFNLFFHQLRKFNSEDISVVGMCLDIGHANLCSETRNDYLRFLDLLDDEVPIIHIHMHENYGDQDSHLTVFSGPAGRDPSGIEGLIKRLKRRNFAGSIIFEQWPEPQSLLIDARDRLIHILREAADTPEEGPVKPDLHEGIVDRFVTANRQFTSWRKRLEWVRDLLLEGPEEPGLEMLVYIAVYLRFLGTGEISSSEEGGHHRPSHHAKLSEQIYRRLAELENAENTLVIRKIYPWLPSFDTEFMRAEPLTRIRDIAHRNDIPKELKQEIKTMLQNKLHRSAGPEDLVTSEALLKRITAPGAPYPQPFIEEFRRFHKELKDFFNAGSLKDMLITLKEKGDIDAPQLIDGFLGLLEGSDEKRGSLDQVIKELELLTGLRRSVTGAGKITTAKEHRLKTTDIRLEDHSFVLLSTIINSIVSSQGLPWDTALRALALVLENLRFGGVAPEECRAVEAELAAWYADVAPEDRDFLLRLKATVDRCRRVAGEYPDKILALFPEKVNTLGYALGVSEHPVKAFAEAVIRSHPVFQLSKLVALLLKSIRTRASLQPWDVIVPGQASGRLTTVRSLASVSDAGDGPLIVLTDKAEGDEEIPWNVTGLIIASETPLLSHLAVRARQRGTVFVSCEDISRIGELKKLSEKPIRICVTADTFEINVTKMKDGSTFKGRTARVIVPEVSPQFPSQKIITLDMVSPATGGVKADGARRLTEIAKLNNADFEVPPGCVIPFGVMEESLRSLPSLEAEYYTTLKEIDRLSHPDIRARLQRIRDLVLQLPLNNELVSGAIAHFKKDDRLIVRSSSNCEDLEGLSGAGLYDSIPNVPQSGIASAVRKVWASLWNSRAAEARQNASVPHGRARMAVLIQTMMPADMSFIMHTLNPVNNNEKEILVEFAVGLGETLASGREPGAPFRTLYRKSTGDIEMLSFASYSAALVQDRRGGTVRTIIDYSKIPFSKDKKFRTELCARVGKIGICVETSFGLPLDIEGLVAGNRIFLVQARPQQRRQMECRR